MPVWGWADKGEEVTVTIAGQTLTAKAGDDGRWKVDAGQARCRPAAGDDRQRLVRQHDHAEEHPGGRGLGLLRPVEHGHGRRRERKNAKKEIAAAHYPNIRLFTVAKKKAAEPADRRARAIGSRAVRPPCAGFSAAAYYFGRQLHKELNVPVGLIETSWGGTPAEFWTSRKTLEANPALKPLAGKASRRVSTTA